jgi:hypothetical protein
LTLSDNRSVDFSARMVLLTSNLGAAENVSSPVTPRLGLQAPSLEDTGASAQHPAFGYRHQPPHIESSRQSSLAQDLASLVAA